MITFERLLAKRKGAKIFLAASTMYPHMYPHSKTRLEYP